MADYCEICEIKSERYERFPHCRDCGAVVCLGHTTYGTEDHDEDGYTCICTECWNEDDEIDAEVEENSDPITDVEF